MTVTAASFRGDFPAFVSTTDYPDVMITFWITLATKLHDAERYGDVLDQAIELYVAHQLALERQSMMGTAQGQAPGQIVGTLTSASVDKVSYSREASSALDPSQGHWNLSTYGLRWKQLQHLFGAGPVQIGTPNPDDAGYSAWPGPYPSPW